MTMPMVCVIVLCIAGVMLACWWMGYEQGRDDTLKNTIFMIERMMDEGKIDGESKHELTHADLVQMEEEAKNKNE